MRSRIRAEDSVPLSVPVPRMGALARAAAAAVQRLSRTQVEASRPDVHGCIHTSRGACRTFRQAG
jgi:hypothetical protein